jgi:hypothetical protein
MNRDDFYKFWTDRGFTLCEGIALTQGSHSLIKLQGCFRSDPPLHAEQLNMTCS